MLDLGFIAKGRLPKLLATADVLVQPGRPGAFNDYRLPSKLPEFLASGRPVVLPATNVALEMTDGVEALFLASGTPDDIAACCERVFREPALAARLGENGAAFARRHFDLDVNTAALIRIYEGVAALPPGKCWEVVRETDGSDLTVAARELAESLQADRSNARGAASDLASLAADLASIVRVEDERESSAAAERDRVRIKLEEAVRHLELQRELTNQHARNLEERTPREKERAWQRYHTVRHFVDTPVCRHRQICQHFGEVAKWESCGACDVCGCGLQWLEHPASTKSSGGAQERPRRKKKPLRRDSPAPASRKEGPGTETAVGAGSELLDRLRRWRRDTAHEQQVPAFVVLHDTTLEEICHKRPRSLAQLREVRGIGELKAERYGRQILDVVGGR